MRFASTSTRWRRILLWTFHLPDVEAVLIAILSILVIMIYCAQSFRFRIGCPVAVASCMPFGLWLSARKEWARKKFEREEQSPWMRRASRRRPDGDQ